MIYTILAIPFGAAALYSFSARVIRKKCLRDITEQESDDLDIPEEDRDGIKVFDSTRAGRWLAVMAVCYYPAFPLLQIEKWLKR